MNAAFFESLSAIAFFGWMALLWVLWGRAARAAGLSRLAFLGAVALFGWLLS